MGAGVPKPLVYMHSSNTLEVLRAMNQPGAPAVDAEALGALATARTFDERLTALTRSYVRMLGQRRPWFQEVIVRRLEWGGLEALSR